NISIRLKRVSIWRTFLRMIACVAEVVQQEEEPQLQVDWKRQQNAIGKLQIRMWRGTSNNWAAEHDVRVFCSLNSLGVFLYSMRVRVKLDEVLRQESSLGDETPAAVFGTWVFITPSMAVRKMR